MKTSNEKSDSRLSSAIPLRLLRDQVYLALFIAVLTLLCRSIIILGMDVSLPDEYWLRDFAGNWVCALIVYLLVQSLKKTMILAGIIIFLFQMSNALKLVILGTPASPDDFFNAQNLYFLVDGWHRALMYSITALPVILAIAFIPWRKPSVWLSIAALTTTGLTLAHNSDPVRVYLDTRFGNSVWNQPANYKTRGLGLHLVQESVRTIAKTGKIPDRASINAALSAVEHQPTSSIQLEPALQAVVNRSSESMPGNSPKRNVHMFVLESFFDPTTLGVQWVPEDPFPDSFRALWKETGHSIALSPVFGGYTANAEFEALCGFPVTRNAVFFEGWLRKPVPCLPDVLNKQGYSTVTSHPNVPGFWNRTHAYNLIGFDHYLSKHQFDMSDSVNGLLLDDSFYAQIFKRLDKDEYQAPFLNYMLTYYGHLPYPGNDNYPDQVKAGKDSVLLHGYLNQMWYKSRDLMQRLSLLQRDDPDALIVIFGDHLPFLGQNYGVYTEAWELPDQRDQFTGEQLERLTSTPLIVIDGKHGPLQLGKLPLYRLPSLIMNLLGIVDQPSMFNLSVNPENTWIRPVYGMHIAINHSATNACAGQSGNAAVCSETTTWLSRTETLMRDIFTGNQFSIESIAR